MSLESSVDKRRRRSRRVQALKMSVLGIPIAYAGGLLVGAPSLIGASSLMIFASAVWYLAGRRGPGREDRVGTAAQRGET
jgi:hypothetical protein